MTSPVLDRTLEAMELMARAESAVERLYETCAALWKEDEDFWQGLAAEEKHHSEYIRSMISILTGNPGNFQPGRPFSAMALQTFISGVERDIESVKHFTVPAVKALHIARDLEPRSSRQKISASVPWPMKSCGTRPSTAAWLRKRLYNCRRKAKGERQEIE
jgi:hypothetical protein